MYDSRLDNTDGVSDYEAIRIEDEVSLLLDNLSYGDVIFVLSNVLAKIVCDWSASDVTRDAFLQEFVETTRVTVEATSLGHLS